MSKKNLSGLNKLIQAIQDAADQLLGNKSHEVIEFSFTELAGDLKLIDGMAAGSFTSMNGTEITLEAGDFPKYVENTQALIDSTKTESGEVVGLPIDMQDHDHKGGAGWLVGVELDEARKVIRFAINWTKEGLSVIKENLRRFFSPMFDPIKKVVLGGSLTNFPATRDENWHLLLRPIELSEQIKEIDMPKSLKKMQDELVKLQAEMAELQGDEEPDEEDEPGDAPPPEVISKELQQLLNTPEGVIEIARRTGMKAEQAVQLQRRVTKVTEFAAQIVTGTAEKPYGAPISAAELTAILLSLPEKQSVAVMEMMRKMWDQVIDFAEHGYGMADFINGKPLPENIAPLAASWVEGGKAIMEFMLANADVLGDAKQYNLAPYIMRQQELAKEQVK